MSPPPVKSQSPPDIRYEIMKPNLTPLKKTHYDFLMASAIETFHCTSRFARKLFLH